LIAGCGAGRETVALALGIPAARIIAVDVSTASLSYAVRMARPGRSARDRPNMLVVETLHGRRKPDRGICMMKLHLPPTAGLEQFEIRVGATTVLCMTSANKGFSSGAGSSMRTPIDKPARSSLSSAGSRRHSMSSSANPSGLGVRAFTGNPDQASVK